MTDYIRLNRIYSKGRYGISRGNGNLLFSPGIADPLPGWDWILEREHPLFELQMSITGPGCRNTFSINPTNKNSDKILKEICSVALRR